MAAPPTLPWVLRELVARHVPGGRAAIEPARLVPQLELVRDLGYDSVRLVELIIASADAFEVELPIEALLGGPPLTVGALAAAVAAAPRAPGTEAGA